MILTADWHLDDKPENAYRWDVFKDLQRELFHTEERRIYILGDLCDRKDRHSAQLVNRIIEELDQLITLYDVSIDIIMGNHDAPVSGPPFWSWLNLLHGQVRFYTEPMAQADLILLPFTKDPAEAWADIDFTPYKAGFMHQPIKHADIGHRRLESGSYFPRFPEGIKLYAGDVHFPQKIGGVTYVGAPSRIRFGDNHQCRFLILDDETYEVTREVSIDAALKDIIAIQNVEDLEELLLRPGDMIRVQFHFEPGSAVGYPVEVEKVRAWAADNGVHLASVEGVMLQEGASVATPRFDAEPAKVLDAFAKQEGLDPGLVEAGHWLLNK